MSGAIALIKLTQSEFDVWLARSMSTYRDENIKNGLTFEEAQKKSDEDFQKLLPEGLQSKDQYLYSIKENNHNWIGTLWFGVRGSDDNRKAFVYDIILNAEVRGTGYGKRAMQLLEEEVKSLGLGHVGLHVFGHNTIARNLYQSLGYEIINLNMEKKL